MASAAGLVGIPYNSAYTASKHGVVGLTRALALEFAGAGVRVNAVCPTGVKTPMVATPLPGNIDWQAVMRSAPWLDGGEMCDPEDIADAVVFLASNEARRITGVASGGRWSDRRLIDHEGKLLRSYPLPRRRIDAFEAHAQQ